jgi:hypothetical protein
MQTYINTCKPTYIDACIKHTPVRIYIHWQCIVTPALAQYPFESDFKQQYMQSMFEGSAPQTRTAAALSSCISDVTSKIQRVGCGLRYYEVGNLQSDRMSLFRALAVQLYGEGAENKDDTIVLQILYAVCVYALEFPHMLPNTDVPNFVEGLIIREEWPDTRCLSIFCHVFKKNVCVWSAHEPKGKLFRHNRKEVPTRCFHIACVHVDSDLREHYASSVKRLTRSSFVGESVRGKPIFDANATGDIAIKHLRPPNDERLRIIWDTNIFLCEEAYDPNDDRRLIYKEVSDGIKKLYKDVVKCFLCTAVDNEIDFIKRKGARRGMRARHARNFINSELATVRKNIMYIHEYLCLEM